jgi:predicted transcriptional regulator
MQKMQILFPNPLMAKLREVAEQEDRPVSELIRRAVERFLEMKPQKPAREIKLPTFKGGEVLVSAGDLKQVIYEDDAL